MYISRGTSREDREGRVQGTGQLRLHLGCINGGWAASDHGHVGEDSDGVVGGAQGRGRRPTGGAPGALAGAVGHGTTGRAPPPIEAAVETVSAADFLAGVAEYGRHYVLRQPAETQEARRSGCAWTRRRGWPGTLSSRQARTSRSYASRVVVRAGRPVTVATPPPCPKPTRNSIQSVSAQFLPSFCPVSVIPFVPHSKRPDTR